MGYKIKEDDIKNGDNLKFFKRTIAKTEIMKNTGKIKFIITEKNPANVHSRKASNLLAIIDVPGLLKIIHATVMIK
ncbi:MAG: hypothetical protein R2941_12005 [Desulfobacterales bacterium]